MRILALLVFAGGCIAADQAPQLPQPALPAGEAEAVLPAGAVLHLRLAGLGQALESIDRLVVPFVPAKAVPPEAQAFLDEPRPLLAFLGAQTVGAPLTPATVTAITGIADGRPLSLTIYPGPPARSFVLALPIGDQAALTGLLLNITRPYALETIAIGKASALDISVGNPDLWDPLESTCRHASLSIL